MDAPGDRADRIIQSIFIYLGVFAQQPDMVAENMRPAGFTLGLLVVLALTAGAMIVMWLGELITEYGVGNGASLIIMAGIISELPTSLNRMRTNDEFYNILVFWILSWIVIVLAIVYITKGARRIPIQYARLTRGRSVYGGQTQVLPRSQHGRRHPTTIILPRSCS